MRTHMRACACVLRVRGGSCTQIVFVAHSIFALIIGATYTGAVAAFLISSSNIQKVDDFDSLATGKFGVAVRGPDFDSSVLTFSLLCYPKFYSNDASAFELCVNIFVAPMCTLEYTRVPACMLRVCELTQPCVNVQREAA